MHALSALLGRWRSMKKVARSQVACGAGLTLIALAWLAHELRSEFARRQVAATDGRDDVAVDYLDQAMKVAPKDHRPAVERGKLESRRGRFAAALAFFDRAVELEPVEPEIRYQRSMVLSAMGRTGEARKEQEEMTRLRKEKEELDKLLEGLLKFPADTDRQIKAARWFFEHGHPDEGVRWALKILRERSDHAESNRMLADHYEKQGNRGLANFYRLQAGGR
jgi:predicted Zn-dependent protease